MANQWANPQLLPWLNSLAAMHHYARQRWPHDSAVQALIPGYGSGIDAGRHDEIPKTLDPFTVTAACSRA
jgi:hypothetical protein